MIPGLPMCGAHIDPFVCLGVDPSTEDATAWENESVWTVTIDDGEF